MRALLLLSTLLSARAEFQSSGEIAQFFSDHGTPEQVGIAFNPEWKVADLDKDFDSEVSAHFIPSAKVKYAKRRAVKDDRPLLVLLTKTGCKESNGLKHTINLGTDVVGFLQNFTVVHAQDQQMAPWQHISGGTYTPQTMLFAPGGDTPIHNKHSQVAPHKYVDEVGLMFMMRQGSYRIWRDEITKKKPLTEPTNTKYEEL
jgi:hypothetical protein